MAGPGDPHRRNWDEDPPQYDAHILAMMAAVCEEKTLCLMVDHNNFFKRIREDVPVQIPSKYTSHIAAVRVSAGGDNGEGHQEVVGSDACIVETEGGTEDEECDTDSDFYDSDFDVEDGDDDLFLANIDKDVNDNNEVSEMVEVEDDAGLDHDDLNLTKEQQLQLEYKFKEFNAEVDLEAPMFKIARGELLCGGSKGCHSCCKSDNSTDQGKSGYCKSSYR